MTLRQLAERERREPAARRLVTVAAAAAACPVIRIRSRIEWLDALTGGGFPLGAVALLHGAPGAGKSTLLAQCAGGIIGAGYISGEEEESQVAARFIRLGVSCEVASVATMQDALDAISGCRFAVMDSLQALEPCGLLAAQLAVAHARANRVAMILVCQQNKEGQHAGLRAIEHLTDCTIRLDRNPRSITIEKNRYGESHVSRFLTMTAKGLTL